MYILSVAYLNSTMIDFHFVMSLSVVYDLVIQTDRFAICSLYILGIL